MAPAYRYQGTNLVPAAVAPAYKYYRYRTGTEVPVLHTWTSTCTQKHDILVARKGWARYTCNLHYSITEELMMFTEMAHMCKRVLCSLLFPLFSNL